jgi:RHS repeat-associated protein
VAQTFCDCGCLNEPGALDVVATSSTGPQTNQSTGAPVRYADGVVTIAATDLHSDEAGFAWGQTRSWSNGPGYATGGDNGTGWVNSYAPHLLQADGQTSNSLIYVVNGTTAYYYDLVNGNYQPRLDDRSRLSYNSGPDTYTLTDTQGDQIVFSGFGTSWLPAQLGQFSSYSNADGVSMAVTSYTSDGHISEMQRAATGGGQTTTESWVNSYVASGVNTGLLASVTLRTKVNNGAWSVVRQVQYAYYDGTQTYGGNAGDLMTATVLDGSNDVLSTSYYRYYVAGAPNGYTDGLEYVFNTDSYDRLTAALGTGLGNLTDTQVAPYADNYFQYDSSQRVTQETAQGGDSQTGGGLATTTFSYTASTNIPGTDSWATKTVTGNPDGSSDTVYTNYVAEVMLTDHYDPASGLHWDHYYAYDGTGQLTLDAAPSAVLGYNDSYPDLLNNQSSTYLSNNSGLITRYDYYTTTTATETAAGGVIGYQQDRQVQQGQQGTLVPQETWQYYAHSASGQTVVPVASDTVYRNTNGSGAETTTYAYTWFSGTAQEQSEVVTRPGISTTQNGPGTGNPDTETTFFDSNGHAIWHKDGDGFLSYTAYDPASGAVVKSIADVDTTKTGDFTGLPAGWSTPSGGGLHLITQYQVDGLGRTTETTSPNMNIAYTVYLDSQQETRTYRGWNASTGLPTGPTEVSRADTGGSYSETLTMTATPHLTNGVPDGTEAISGLQTLARQYTNSAGQVIAADAYFNLSGVTYSTAAHIGTLNTNYYETAYGYDSEGRQNRVQAPTGTITRTVYDSLGRAVSSWVGTNDTPPSGEWSPSNNGAPANMVQVSASAYDGGGVGDGDLTQLTQYPGLGAAARVSQNWYDWRDRVVASKDGVQGSESDGTNRPIMVTTYDNRNEVTQTQRYSGDGVTPQVAGGVLQALSPSLLRAQTSTSYDDQGRVYQTQVSDVSPTTGVVGMYTLTTNDWYNHRGLVMKDSPAGGPSTKTAYDGAGRATVTYTTDANGDAAPGQPNSWANAATVSSTNAVLEQVETGYDADGNVVQTTTRQRNHDETTGGPLGNPTTAPKARVSYLADYYDAADRLTASVDVGTNGGSAWTRPSSVPTASDTVLVTSYAYNAMGLVQDTTDPKGLDTRRYYDALGRVTKSVQDYTGAAEGAENDVATEYSYDGDGHQLTVQADEPGGAYQRTAYAYGVTTAGGSAINSNDLLAAVQHPDPSSGNPSTDQQVSLTGAPTGGTFTLTFSGQTTAAIAYNVSAAAVQSALQALSAIGAGNVQVSGAAGGPWQVHFAGALAGANVPDLSGNGAGLTGGTSPAVAVSAQQDTYAYDALGEVLTTTDRNGNVHTDSYDVLGRLTSDAVTTLGAGVDGTVRRIQYAYDSQGNKYLVTSYNAAMGDSIVNQVQDVFNGLGQLTGEYQSHSGAVVIGTTPEVQYAYTEMAGGANNSRLTGITYPSNYVLSYNYNTGLDSNISRLSYLSDSSAPTLESYLYLGLGTVVERDHPQSHVNLTYIKQTGDTQANMDGGDQYTGLDRFGRVIDQNWYNTSTSTSTDRFQYGYDRDGNVLWRNNLVNTAFGELYAYDNLNQLTSFQRGTLNSTHTGLLGSASRSQSWSPDALGNFSGVTTNGTQQTRTANQQNEITSISGAGAITYDANGNTTADGSGNSYAYDAWNRLVAVKSGSTTVASYAYDGLGNRVSVTEGGATTDLYNSTAGQVLEERVGGQVQARNVWGPGYVNELVLRDQSSQHNGVLDQRLYVQQDANWDVTAVAGATGGVLERYADDPFGAVAVLTPGWGALGSSAYAMPYLWQGERYDWAVGLYHTDKRDVSPTLMRPMQADPLGLGPDVNDYRWEDNDSTNKTDPSGMVVSLYKTSVFGTNKYHIRIVVWDQFSDKMVFYDGRGPRKLFLPAALCFSDVPIEAGTGEREPAGRSEPPLHYNAVYTEKHAFVGGKKYPLPYIGENYSPFLTNVSSANFKEEIDALDKAFRELSQVPTYRVTGPTSNTYARQLLTLAGYKTNDYYSGFPGWNYRGDFGYGGKYFDKYGKPTPAWKVYQDECSSRVEYFPM